MQNRHATQIRQLLEKKRLSKSRFNPQSRVLLNSPSMKQSRQIKKSSSSSSFHLDKQKQLELHIMQKRYQQLYFQYQKIVHQSKKKAQLCKRQQQEITKYEKAGERDKTQISRLKSMIGMIDKQENGVQTVQDKPNFDQQYNFLQKFTPYTKISKLKESHSYKDLPIANSKHYSINTIQKDGNHKFSVQNPKMSSSLLNQSRKQSKRKSLELKDQDMRSIKEQMRDRKQTTKGLQLSKVNQSIRLNDYGKMAQSLLYANKSSIDFRRKKTHFDKGSSTVQSALCHNEQNTQSQPKISNPNAKISNSRVTGSLMENQPNVRVKSPNSKFKFIPSVDF